jgi:hypothetical protein
MLCERILTFGSSGTSNQVVAVFLVPSGVFRNIRNRPVSPFFHNRNLPITFTWSNWSEARAFPVTVIQVLKLRRKQKCMVTILSNFKIKKFTPLLYIRKKIECPEYVILDDFLPFYPGNSRGSTWGISVVVHFPYLEQICNYPG